MNSRSGDGVALQGLIDLPRKVSRSGCPTEISYPKSLQTSTSSGIRPLPPSQPSSTTTSRGMVSSSTPRSLTLHADEKSSESSFSMFATVLRIGLWSVMRYPEYGRTSLTVAGINTRRSLSARKLRASVRSAARRGELLGQSAVVLTVPSLQSSCMKPLGIGEGLHCLALWPPAHAERRS